MFSQTVVRLMALALPLVAAACAGEREQAGRDEMGGMTAAAEYTIVLKSTWTPANHPFEYPKAGPLTGPHFSGLIGATHNPGYTLFAEGTPPTAGLERLSEEGKHSPLDEEIRGVIASGAAGALFESGPLRNFADSLVTTVQADPTHPMLSLVAMIAPSPDWFTGVANVNLMENGEWVSSRTIQLYAWDSGGDDGATYTASDRDTNPKRPTSRAATRHFVANDQAVPVGTLTISRR